MSLRLPETTSNVPILAPISVIVAAATSRTISFPNEFFGELVSFLLTNLDAAAVATYRINGLTQPLLTLGADSFRGIDDTKIRLLEINAAAGGAAQLQGQVQLLR